MAKKPKKTKVSLKSQIEKIAEQKTQEVMKNLPSKIEKALDSCFHSLLGLNVRGYNGGEIDHCNGRWNLFAEVLKAEAVKDVSEMIKTIKHKYSFDEFKDAFKKEYISHFRYYMKYYAEKKAKELSELYINKSIEEIVPKKIETSIQ